PVAQGAVSHLIDYGDFPRHGLPLERRTGEEADQRELPHGSRTPRLADTSPRLSAYSGEGVSVQSPGGFATGLPSAARCVWADRRGPCRPRQREPPPAGELSGVPIGREGVQVVVLSIVPRHSLVAGRFWFFWDV